MARSKAKLSLPTKRMTDTGNVYVLGLLIWMEAD